MLRNYFFITGTWYFSRVDGESSFESASFNGSLNSLNHNIMSTYSCRAGVCLKWIYAKTSEIRELCGPQISWFMIWMIKRIMRNQAHGQGMGRHTPEEVQHIVRLDLNALEGFFGMSVQQNCYVKETNSIKMCALHDIWYALTGIF